MRFGSTRLSCLATMTLLLAAPLRAEWQPPADNAFTEKQVVTYIECLKDVMDQWKAMGKKVEGSNSAAAIAALAGVDEKFEAILAKHGTQRKEFEWMGGQVTMAYGIAIAGDALTKLKTEYEAQAKKAQQDLADTRKKLVGYETAGREGKRYLGKEEREIAVKEAKDQHQAFADELKQHTDEVKVISEEVAKDEADARAADTEAKNIPAGVAEADREDYVKGKKADADAARAAAKEAREREIEAKKLVVESKAKADLAARKVANPEIPLSDEEKAQAKQENEDGIKACKEEIEKIAAGIEMVKNAEAQLAKMAADQAKEVPAANVELMKKHMQEFTAAWGAEEKK